MVAMAKAKTAPLTARLARWRIWVQATFLLVWLGPATLRFHTVCSPVFHCHSCPLATLACPIGVLANFSALHVVPLLAIGTLLVVGAALGSFVCGWICPFGLFQDLLGRIPAPKFTLPGWTSYGRYAVLGGLVIAVPFFFGERHPLFFCRLCPAGALEAAFPNTAALALAGEPLVWPSALKAIILIALVAVALFTWRPWCTALCPLGAVYSLANLFSFVFLGVDRRGCTDCGLCRSVCRYGEGPRRRGSDLRCVRCLDCTRCSRVTLSSVFSRPPSQETDERASAARSVGTGRD